VVIEEIIQRRAKASNNIFYIYKVTDGIQSTSVTVWADVHNSQDEAVRKVGGGIRIQVTYDKEHNNFKIANGSDIITLVRRAEEEYALI
jgi:hypothetical protein